MRLISKAARAQQLGIPVYTIALGTASGTIEQPDAPGSGQRLSVPPDEDTIYGVKTARARLARAG